MNMRILLMADTPRSIDSGAAGTEVQTAEALRRLGHEVDEVWTAAHPRVIAHDNLRYLLELPLLYRREMLERVRKRHYDVVHVNQPHGYLAARALRQVPGRGVFVHRSHGLETRARMAEERWRHALAPRRRLRELASSLMSSALRINERGIARWADGHIVSSTLCARTLEQSLRVPAERVCVVAQAAPDAFHAPAPPMDESRLQRILYVGRLDPSKAPEVLARALAAITSSNPRATFTWVCDRHDHEAAMALLPPHARARTSFRDWMPQGELISVCDSHGIFLFPSHFEGFGKAFLEAMCRGLAVVATDEGGAHDIIEDGANGHIVPVGDAAAIAERVLALQAAGLSYAARMGQNARQSALAYTWDRTARETADFYTRLRLLAKGNA